MDAAWALVSMVPPWLSARARISPIGRWARVSASVLMTLIASVQSVSVAAPDTVVEANLSSSAMWERTR